METRLDADFSDVRIHADAAARVSAAEIGALAYTSGSHVVIADAGADKRALAHELTHVIQQRRGLVAGRDYGGGLRVSDPGEASEREASATAARVMSGSASRGGASRVGSSPARDGTSGPGPAVIQRISFFSILRRPAWWLTKLILHWGYDRFKLLVQGLGDEALSLSDDLLEQAIAKAAGARAALRPAPEPFRPVSELTKTAIEGRERGLRTNELLELRDREAEEAKVRGFSAALVGAQRGELDDLALKLVRSRDDLDRRKLEMLQRAEFILAALEAGDFRAHLGELRDKIGEKERQLLGLTSVQAEAKSILQSITGSARPRVRSETIVAAENVRDQYISRYKLLAEISGREIQTLQVIIRSIRVPPARSQDPRSVKKRDKALRRIALISPGDLTIVGSYLEEQITAARDFYDVSRLEQMLSRVRREPKAREVLDFIGKKGVAGLFAAKNEAAELLEEAVTTLQALQPWRIVSHFTREDQETIDNREYYEAEAKKFQGLYAELEELSELYANEDYADRIGSVIRVQNWSRKEAIKQRVDELEKGEASEEEEEYPSVPLEQFIGDGDLPPLKKLVAE
jgi:hypothetical protein